MCKSPYFVHIHISHNISTFFGIEIFVEYFPVSWEHTVLPSWEWNDKRRIEFLFPSAIQSSSATCISSKGESCHLFNRWFCGLCWRWQVSDPVYWGRFLPESVGHKNPIKFESVKSKIFLDWRWGFRLPPYLYCQMTCGSHVFLTKHSNKPSILPVLPPNLLKSSACRPKIQTTADCMSCAFPMFKQDKFIE